MGHFAIFRSVIALVCYKNATHLSYIAVIFDETKGQLFEHFEGSLCM